MPPPDTPPAALSFQRRRWTVVFTLPFAAFMGLGGLFSLLWAPQQFGARLGWPMALVLGLTGLALAVSIGGSAWQALREAGPALVVDARGITDNFHLKTHLPWSAIARATVDHGSGNDLMLTLRPGARLPSSRVLRTGFWRSVGRAFNGGDLRIPLGSLVYDHNRLRAALKAHLAQPAHQVQAGKPSDKPR